MSRDVCPKCSATAQQAVTQSRTLERGVRWRRRKCSSCGKSYSTVEVLWQRPRRGLPRAVKAMIAGQVDAEDVIGEEANATAL